MFHREMSLDDDTMAKLYEQKEQNQNKHGKSVRVYESVWSGHHFTNSTDNASQGHVESQNDQNVQKESFQIMTRNNSG